MRLLIVDDDIEFAGALAESLTKRGIAVDVAGSGDEARHLIRIVEYSAVLLDLSLPDADGLGLVRLWRQAQQSAPILMVSGCDDVTVRVEALRAGADDFVVKPFALEELIARIGAVVRRRDGFAGGDICFGSLRFDPASRQLSINEVPVVLSAREADVIEILMRRPGRITSRRLLEDQLFGAGDELGSNAVEVYVYRLRRKIEAAPDVSIQTVRGIGYLLVAGNGGDQKARDGFDGNMNDTGRNSAATSG